MCFLSASVTEKWSHHINQVQSKLFAVTLTPLHMNERKDERKTNIHKYKTNIKTETSPQGSCPFARVVIQPLVFTETRYCIYTKYQEYPLCTVITWYLVNTNKLHSSINPGLRSNTNIMWYIIWTVPLPDGQTTEQNHQTGCRRVNRTGPDRFGSDRFLPFDRRTMFSRKVFWGATRPRRPPAILQREAESCRFPPLT